MSEIKTKAVQPMRGTLAVRVRRSITRSQIEEILERIYKESGCPTCGLGGRDFHLLLEDPRFNVNQLMPVLKIENVLGIEMTPIPAFDPSAIDTGLR